MPQIWVPHRYAQSYFSKTSVQRWTFSNILLYKTRILTDGATSAVIKKFCLVLLWKTLFANDMQNVWTLSHVSARTHGKYRKVFVEIKLIKKLILSWLRAQRLWVVPIFADGQVFIFLHWICANWRRYVQLK